MIGKKINHQKTTKRNGIFVNSYRMPFILLMLLFRSQSFIHFLRRYFKTLDIAICILDGWGAFFCSLLHHSKCETIDSIYNFNHFLIEMRIGNINHFNAKFDANKESCCCVKYSDNEN